MEENEKNYYFIEGVSQKDIIGFDSYILALKNAIKNNSKFIGLLSDFGKGKSPLIKMLSDDKSMNSDVITINLWNCENNSIDDNDKIDIHSLFLHQLINELDIKSKEYYKIKINKNYGLFDLKL